MTTNISHFTFTKVNSQWKVLPNIYRQMTPSHPPSSSNKPHDNTVRVSPWTAYLPTDEQALGLVQWPPSAPGAWAVRVGEHQPPAGDAAATARQTGSGRLQQQGRSLLPNSVCMMSWMCIAFAIFYWASTHGHLKFTGQKNRGWLLTRRSHLYVQRTYTWTVGSSKMGGWALAREIMILPGDTDKTLHASSIVSSYTRAIYDLISTHYSLSMHVDLSCGNELLWDFVCYKVYTCVAELWKHTIQNFQTWFIGTASG